MNRKLKIAIIVVLVLILAYTAFYFTEYRHAEKSYRFDEWNGKCFGY